MSDVGGQGRHEREEEGCLFYGVYKQAYIHERHECTRKCMMSRERLLCKTALTLCASDVSVEPLLS
jgi:hypothetical protein